MSNVPGPDRAAKWNRRYDADRIKAIIDAEKPVFYGHAQVKFQMLAEMESAVKTVLNIAGISVKDTANYLAFSRQLWKQDQTYAGTTLAEAAAQTIAHWVSRGLAQATMETIRSQVFNIPAPTP